MSPSPTLLPGFPPGHPRESPAFSDITSLLDLGLLSRDTCPRANARPRACVWNKDRIEAGLLEGGACPGLWGWEAPEARREGHQGAEPRTQSLPGRSGAEL